MTQEIVFLKLGGSLITDKNSPQTPRPEVLVRLANEIQVVRSARPDLRILVGHGSGSFGHVEAKKYGTRAGVQTAAAWQGFGQVAAVAGALNRIVVDALRTAGLPALNFSPSASVVAEDGVIASMAVEPIAAALAQGLMPVVHGDVAFDRVRGGTIVSTEDVFGYLAGALKPSHIYLAGIEDGVLSQFPGGEVLARITPANFEAVRAGLGGSASTDVTGGMASKVALMLAQVQAQPGLQIHIFSGETPGQVLAHLLGDPDVIGTVIAGS